MTGAKLTEILTLNTYWTVMSKDSAYLLKEPLVYISIILDQLNRINVVYSTANSYHMYFAVQ